MREFIYARFGSGPTRSDSNRTGHDFLTFLHLPDVNKYSIKLLAVEFNAVRFPNMVLGAYSVYRCLSETFVF